jgi:uracil-DNA glycosylase
MNNSFNVPGWPPQSDWTELLAAEFQSDYFRELMTFVVSERESQTIFPPTGSVFNAFKQTPHANTRVVILGQDPYHGAGQAHGLSFSVENSIKLPPSLKNIYKELAGDIGCAVPTSGNLLPWAQQGVLLLNTVLTVREGQANSHRKKGWEKFTDRVVEVLGQQESAIVFILWGNPAQKKEKLIGGQHTIIKSVHPSPLSSHRGFFGSKPFSKANEVLKKMGHEPINWVLP